jgi:hypothetical protein
LYSCQFGTFLFNSERERREGSVGTVSVWDYMNSPPQPEKYTNPEYNPALDDPTSRAPMADQGVLLPNPKDVRFWHELYGRGDEEMNGRYVATPAPLSALSIVENPEEDPGLPGTTISLSPPTTLPHHPPSPSPASSPALTPSLSPARVPSPLAPGPRPVRATSTDLFGSAGEGVRSVWDRLSSGAGAALSVVQDAYGTARDARTRSVGGGGGGLGELQDWSGSSPRRASPSVISASPTLPRFELPRTTEAVRASTFSSASKGTMVNPWAMPSSAPNTSAPREVGGMPSVLLDNPWNTARMPPRPAAPARRPPLEDAFAVGGLDAALPPLPSSASDPLGIASAAGTSTPHALRGLPADPSVALPPAAVHDGTDSAASASSAAAALGPPLPPPPLPLARSLDASVGSRSSGGDDEAAPRIELSGISEGMDPLGVVMR